MQLRHCRHRTFFLLLNEDGTDSTSAASQKKTFHSAVLSFQKRGVSAYSRKEINTMFENTQNSLGSYTETRRLEALLFRQ